MAPPDPGSPPPAPATAPPSPALARSSSRKRARPVRIEDEIAAALAADSAKRRRLPLPKKPMPSEGNELSRAEVVAGDLAAKNPMPSKKVKSEDKEEGAAGLRSEPMPSEVKEKVGKVKARSNGKKKSGEDDIIVEDEEVPEDEEEGDELVVAEAPAPALLNRKAVAKKKSEDSESCFVGDPIPIAEAKQYWPDRYCNKVQVAAASSSRIVEEDPEDVKARHHYRQAKVDDVIYNLNDDVYVMAGEDTANYIGRIIEFFEGIDKQLHFTARWFFKAEDTVIKDFHKDHDPKKVFISYVTNVNVLDCILSKIKIVEVAWSIDSDTKKEALRDYDFYYDMSYSLAYSTFANLSSDKGVAGHTISSSASISSLASESTDLVATSSTPKTEFSLLDLYSGCGAMSTGLCLGAKLSGVNLVTKWAVDYNQFACESLRMNHPEAKVYNEKAEDFLSLIQEWEKLCIKYGLLGTDERTVGQLVPSYDLDAVKEENTNVVLDEPDEDNEDNEENDEDGEVFEVGEIIGICFGDPNETDKKQLMFKIRWKGYDDPSEDTWEPMEGLSNCEEKLQFFVQNGFQKRILPLPGMVDVICGGPPCQGISGHNRFRNLDTPLDDEKNKQLIVFMDTVEYLKPRHVLMENVVDIVKAVDGLLGRYAVSRLVKMNYQAKLGILAAGSFGLPQFRMRCFLWGAQRSEKLPSFPLPTHDAVGRAVTPNTFEDNVVKFPENKKPTLKKALLLRDAISDLPPVNNNESREERAYEFPPLNDFQYFIRLPNKEQCSASTGDTLTTSGKLFDHVPLKMSDDDYQRVCRIPRIKGACFRDLPGLIVGKNNVVERDPHVPKELLPSGKPLIPDYAIKFVKGKSLKPFARLWWDEVVPTVLTRAQPHNRAILHPEQDRVMTVRENARLQGFPDFYRLYGPVKQKYMQVGNAVAIPVSRALGYGLGRAYLNVGNDGPSFFLPPSFPKAC